MLGSKEVAAGDVWEPGEQEAGGESYRGLFRLYLCILPMLNMILGARLAGQNWAGLFLWTRQLSLSVNLIFKEA